MTGDTPFEVGADVLLRGASNAALVVPGYDGIGLHATAQLIDKLLSAACEVARRWGTEVPS